MHLSEVKCPRALYGLLGLGLALSACRSGAVLQEGQAQISFAERQWAVKGGDFKRGPGNNFFGQSKQSIYRDWRGHLHLRLHQARDRVYCVEINSLDTLGYGRYQFTLESDFQQFESNMVLGLFTWDHSSFETQANSEVDIEFSKWGFPLAASLLHYSVHPVALERLHQERSYSSHLSPSALSGISTHIIEWRDTSVSFASYRGAKPIKENLVDRFHYSFKNPLRQKSVGGKRSSAITVPKPGLGVQAHVNFWLLGPQKELDGDSPEVIIRDFRFEAF